MVAADADLLSLQEADGRKRSQCGSALVVPVKRKVVPSRAGFYDPDVALVGETATVEVVEAVAGTVQVRVKTPSV